MGKRVDKTPLGKPKDDPVYEETLEQQEAEREFMNKLGIFEMFRADQEHSDE